MVSVDVKRHVYLLTYETEFTNRQSLEAEEHSCTELKTQQLYSSGEKRNVSRFDSKQLKKKKKKKIRPHYPTPLPGNFDPSIPSISSLRNKPMVGERKRAKGTSTMPVEPAGPWGVVVVVRHQQDDVLCQ